MCKLYHFKVAALISFHILLHYLYIEEDSKDISFLEDSEWGSLLFQCLNFMSCRFTLIPVVMSLALQQFGALPSLPPFQFLYTFYELLEVCHDGLYFFLLSFSFSFYFEFVHIQFLQCFYFGPLLFHCYVQCDFLCLVPDCLLVISSFIWFPFLCNCLPFHDCLRLCFHLCLFLFVISQSHASVHVVPFSLCSQTRLLFILMFVFLIFWISLQFYFMPSLVLILSYLILS